MMVKDLINNSLKSGKIEFSEDIENLIDIFLLFLKEKLYYNKKLRGQEIRRIEMVMSNLFDFYVENPESILNFVKNMNFQFHINHGKML